jgi:hypothetical protein
MAQKQHKGVSKKSAFLAAFVATASITRAAAAVPIERGMHYRWLSEDPEYLTAFGAAREQAAQTLEDEAVRRAHEGIDEPVVYQGDLCFPLETTIAEDGEVITRRSSSPLLIRKYSDGLLQFLLKGFRPEKYRDRGSVEVSGPNGGPIPLTDNRLASLTDEQLASLVAITRQLASVEGARSGTPSPVAE